MKHSSRDLRRLEKVSLSPIFAQFAETLNGVSTIRAYGAAHRFQLTSEQLVDSNTRCYFAQFYTSQWFVIRLDALGNTVLSAAIFLPLVSTHVGQSVSIALAGVAIAYTLELTQFLKFLAKVFATAYYVLQSYYLRANYLLAAC